MTHASGNPTWQPYPDESTLVTAAALEAIENALDAAVSLVCQARGNTVQAISSTPWTPVNLAAEDVDDDNVHSTATNTGRFTYTRAGLYELVAFIPWAAGQSAAAGTTGRQARLVRNGTLIPGGLVSGQYGGTYLDLVIPPLLVPVASGDYIELQAFSQLNNAPLTGAAESGPRITSRLIRPA